MPLRPSSSFQVLRSSVSLWLGGHQAMPNCTICTMSEPRATVLPLSLCTPWSAYLGLSRCFEGSIYRGHTGQIHTTFIPTRVHKYVKCRSCAQHNGTAAQSHGVFSCITSICPTRGRSGRTFFHQPRSWCPVAHYSKFHWPFEASAFVRISWRMPLCKCGSCGSSVSSLHITMMFIGPDAWRRSSWMGSLWPVFASNPRNQSAILLGLRFPAYRREYISSYPSTKACTYYIPKSTYLAYATSTREVGLATSRAAFCIAPSSFFQPPYCAPVCSAWRDDRLRRAPSQCCLWSQALPLCWKIILESNGSSWAISEHWISGSKLSPSIPARSLHPIHQDAKRNRTPEVFKDTSTLSASPSLSPVSLPYTFRIPAVVPASDHRNCQFLHRDLRHNAVYRTSGARASPHVNVNAEWMAHFFQSFTALEPKSSSSRSPPYILG